MAKIYYPNKGCKYTSIFKAGIFILIFVKFYEILFYLLIKFFAVKNAHQ